MFSAAYLHCSHVFIRTEYARLFARVGAGGKEAGHEPNRAPARVARGQLAAREAGRGHDLTARAQKRAPRQQPTVQNASFWRKDLIQCDGKSLAYKDLQQGREKVGCH